MNEPGQQTLAGRIRQFCAQKDHALAEYALAGMDNKLFVSKYQLHLPKPAQLRRRLERAMQEGTP